jgi:hypothetical protein
MNSEVLRHILCTVMIMGEFNVDNANANDQSGTSSSPATRHSSLILTMFRLASEPRQQPATTMVIIYIIRHKIITSYS